MPAGRAMSIAKAGALIAVPASPESETWLTPPRTEYALKHLWALVSNGAPFCGSPRIRIHLAKKKDAADRKSVV